MLCDCVGWLVVLGLNDPLRRYFSLYRAVCDCDFSRVSKLMGFLILFFLGGILMSP